MNSIGVDFKIKNVECDGKVIKLQIVIYFLKYFFSGIQQGKRDLEQLQRVTTEERMLFVLFTMLLIENHSIM